MKMLDKINSLKKLHPGAKVTFEINLLECCNDIFIDEEFTKVSVGNYITYNNEFIKDIDYLREVIEMEIIYDSNKELDEDFEEKVNKRMKELKKEFKKYIVVSLTD